MTSDDELASAIAEYLEEEHSIGVVEHQMAGRSDSSQYIIVERTLSLGHYAGIMDEFGAAVTKSMARERGRQKVWFGRVEVSLDGPEFVREPLARPSL